MAKLTKNGYGQVELNQVAFRRDGRIEAQLPFYGNGGDTCENGMIIAVNNGKTEYAGTAPAGKIFGLVYTSEELYNSGTPGLKNFALAVNGTAGVTGYGKGPEGYNVLPRIGYLDIGDKFTTNAIDDAEVDFDTTGAAYGIVGASGNIVLTTATTSDGGPVMRKIKKTTMPDGQEALQFIVIKA